MEVVKVADFKEESLPEQRYGDMPLKRVSPKRSYDMFDSNLQRSVSQSSSQERVEWDPPKM